MREITQAWLDSEKDDLAVMGEILKRSDLTNVTAFHAQQCAEKCFKAMLEERKLPVRKTHSLTQLIGLIADLDPRLPT
jgi:HEPN domain-containing protein